MGSPYITKKYISLSGMDDFKGTEAQKMATFLAQSDRLVLNYQAQKDCGVDTDLTERQYLNLQKDRCECIERLKELEQENG